MAPQFLDAGQDALVVTSRSGRRERPLESRQEPERGEEKRFAAQDVFTNYIPYYP